MVFPFSYQGFCSSLFHVIINMYLAVQVCLLMLVALSAIRMSFLLLMVLMSNACTNWSVLCWNVRGLNSEARQRAVRQKLDESLCVVACFQETKCASFDFRSIRSFCPKRFDSFAFSPCEGASGGILIVWNSSVFWGTVIEIQHFAVVVQFISKQNNEQWSLVFVYGPCQGEARNIFVSWLYNLHIPMGENWLVVGDFNFIRSLENRNLSGVI